MKKSAIFFIIACCCAQTMAQTEKVFKEDILKYDFHDEIREHPLRLTKHVQYDLSKDHEISFNSHNSSPEHVSPPSKKKEKTNKKTINSTKKLNKN